MGAVPLPKGKFGPRELVRWPVQTSRGLLYGFNEVNLENLLSSDEELLWWEEPRTGLTRHGNDWLVALMAVSLLLVPLILLDAASQTNDSIREGVGALSDTALFAIGAVGAVFVGSGIYLLAVHYWWDKRKRDDVAYAITTQRAFWARHHNSGLTVRSAPLWDIDSISMTRDADNRGTVRIRSGVIDWKVTSWKRGRYAWKDHDGPFFQQITAPDTVRDLLVRLKREHFADGVVPHSGMINSLWWDELRSFEKFRWRGHSPWSWGSERVFDRAVGFLVVRTTRWAPTQGVASRLDSLLCNRQIHRRPWQEYMLTDRRVAIFYSNATEFVRRIPLNSIDRIWIQPGQNGRGTIMARSWVRDWPFRDTAGYPIAGPLLEEVDSADELLAAMIPYTGVQPEYPGTSAEVQASGWLDEGELLLWSSVPNGDRPIPGRMAAVIAALIVYGVVVIPWLWYVFNKQAPQPGGAGLVYGAVLLAIAMCGLYVTYFQFQFDVHRQDGTVRGVTDRRAIRQTRRWVEFTELKPGFEVSGSGDNVWQQAMKHSTGKTRRYRFDDYSARADELELQTVDDPAGTEGVPNHVQAEMR